MASKDWKLPDAQHKITEEKGLDIENESIQRQWEKTIVSLIRLEDAFSDIDVYDDTEEGEIPYKAYSLPVYRRGYDCPKESGICFPRNQVSSVTSDSSMIRYTSDSKHHKR